MSRPDLDEVVLEYVGPAVTGAPARDLTRGDVHRIAYRQRLAETAADGQRPVVTAADIRTTTAGLVARGRYRRVRKETTRG